MIQATKLATDVTLAAKAKGGRSKAHEVTVAQAAEIQRLTFESLADESFGEVAAFLAKYRPR